MSCYSLELIVEIVEDIQGRNSRRVLRGRNWSTGCEGMLRAGLLPCLAHPVSLYTTPIINQEDAPSLEFKSIWWKDFLN